MSQEFNEPAFSSEELQQQVVSELVIKTPDEPIAPRKMAEVVPIPVNHNGLAIARDNAELMRIIKVMMAGMAFPKTLDTEAKILAAWQVAASLRLPPAVAIQNIAIIHGSACLWGQLPKALAEATGEMEDFQLILINEQQKPISLDNLNLTDEVWGAVCRMKRKGRTLNEYTFTMADAQKANLANKTGPWKDYRKIMLSRRAVSHAIKFEFPDALMGVPVAEYDHNDAPDFKDVTPGMNAREAAKNAIDRKLRGES